MTDINEEFEHLREKLQLEEIIQDLKINKQKNNKFSLSDKFHTGLNISTTFVVLIMIIIIYCIYHLKIKPNLQRRNTQKAEIEFEWVNP